jgi:hypothetical protein
MRLSLFLSFPASLVLHAAVHPFPVKAMASVAQAASGIVQKAAVYDVF